jgi:hypothetical protein
MVLTTLYLKKPACNKLIKGALKLDKFSVMTEAMRKEVD